MELIEIVHPSGEHFMVNADDLRGDLDVMIPLYELDGTKRSRADAWLGSGKPSDIQRRTAIECRVVQAAAHGSFSH
jgi:hypothetical protein